MSDRRKRAEALFENFSADVPAPQALDRAIYNPDALEAFEDVDRDMVVVNTDGTIQIGQFVMERTGLTHKGSITKDDWLNFGERLSQLKDSIQWILGDWANLGLEHAEDWIEDSDEELEQLSDELPDGKYRVLLMSTPYAYKTLRNFAYVAGQIPMPRRRDTLSFTHHAEVAPRNAEEQEALLERAEQENLSTRQLREIMHPSVEAVPMELFEDNLKSFRRKQRSLAKKVAPHQRLQMAEYLRRLADEIEQLPK